MTRKIPEQRENYVKILYENLKNYSKLSLQRKRSKKMQKNMHKNVWMNFVFGNWTLEITKKKKTSYKILILIVTFQDLNWKRWVTECL